MPKDRRGRPGVGLLEELLGDPPFRPEDIPQQFGDGVGQQMQAGVGGNQGAW